MEPSVAAATVNVNGKKSTISVATCLAANGSSKSTVVGAGVNAPEPPKIDRVDSAMSVVQPNDTAPAVAAATGEVDKGVRVLELCEWKEAAYSLAEAFAEDHSCTYFFETPDTAHWSKQRKWELHLSMMEYITYAHLLKGLVVSAGPNYDCVGLWYVPNESPMAFAA